MTISRIRSVQMGLHASTTDFTVAPVSPLFKEPEVANVMPRDRVRHERETFRDDNQNYAEILGGKQLEALNIDLKLRGFSANTGAVLDSQTQTEVGPLLTAICGSAATEPASTATTVTGDTGASSTITVASGTNVVNGAGVLFDTTVSSVSIKNCREVVSGGGTGTLVLDRDHADGAPGGDNVLYRGTRWDFTPSVSKHTHVGIIAEGEDWYRYYNGCMSNLVLKVEPGMPVTFSTSWMPTGWSDAAEVNPTFTAPTAGAYVMGVNSSLWIGDDKVLLKSCELDFGHVITPRPCINGTDGVHGYLVTRKSPVLKGRLYFGVGGLSFGELADSTGNISLNKIQGLTTSAAAAATAGTVASTYDVALQVGDSPTQAMYVRMAAATFRGRLVEENGIECCDFECHARRPSSGAPVRLFLF